MFGFSAIINAGPASPTIDADAQTFITNASISDATEQSAINNFVTKAKLLNLWNDLETIYPFIGSTSASGRYNVKTGLQEGTFYGGFSYGSGVLFNGINGYFDTGWQTTAGNLYDRHLSQYIISQTTTGTWTGSFDGVNVFGMRINTGRILSFAGFNNLEGALNINIDRSSVTCVTIDSNTVGKIYNNGSLVHTNSTSINATPSAYTVFIGALNQSGTATFFQDSKVAFVTTGKKLDSTKQAQLNNLVREFNAILGR